MPLWRRALPGDRHAARDRLLPLPHVPALERAPAQAWATYPIGQVVYEATAPQVYRSSSWGERRFCPTCGSQLEFREAENPATISLNLGTLDDPSAITPGCHIYCSSQLPWFELADDLPRHPKDSG